VTSEQFKIIKDISNNYDKALCLVKILFQDITDKEGEPYLNHLLRVSSKLSNEDTKVAGLLHDTLEDIPNFTTSTLKELGFNDTIITLVKIVTNSHKSSSYHDYITSILKSNNIEAIKLKFADMSDNYNTQRMAALDSPTRIKLINKYQNEYERLKKYLEERGKNYDRYKINKRK